MTTDYETHERRLRALGDQITYGAANAHATAKGAEIRARTIDNDLADAVLGLHMGTCSEEDVARLRRERQAVQEALENARIVDDAAERAQLKRSGELRFLRRAKSRNEPFVSNLPTYLTGEGE